MKELTAIEGVQSAETLRCVVDSLPTPVAVIDAGGRVEVMNRAWRALVEQTAPDEYDVSGGTQCVPDILRRIGLVADENIADVERAIKDVLSGRLDDFEWASSHVALPGGIESPRKVRIMRSPGDGSKRAIVTIVDIARTISCERAAEREAPNKTLREGAWYLAKVQRIAHIGHWERDAGADTSRWSDEVYRILGLTKSNASPSFDAFISRVHPDDRQRVQKAVDQAWRTGEELTLDFRIQHPDGEIRHLHDHVEFDVNEAGKPVRMFGIVQDVTEQKRVETWLRDQATAHSIRAAMRDVDRNLPSSEFWRLLIAAVVDGFGFSGGWFGEVSGDYLGVVCEYGRIGRVPRRVEINALEHSEMDDASTIRAAVLHGRPYRREDLSGYLHAKRVATMTMRPEHRSHLGIPVMIDAEVAGAILLVADQAAAFPSERVSHIQELINEMGERLQRYQSERKAAHALRRKERQLLQVISEMPVMMIAFAENGAIVAWNQECERVTGFSAREITNHPNAIAKLYPDEKHKEVFYKNWMLHGGDFRDWELETACKNGHTRMIAWSRVSDRFPISGWAKWGIGIDVTDRRKAEYALAQSERDYRGLFDNAHDAIIILRPEDEVVLEANPHACKLYGLSRSEFIGLSLIDISKDISHGRRKIAEALETLTSISYETTQYRNDGTLMLLEVNAAVIEYRGERAIMTINRDITSRRLIEENVRNSEARYRWLAEHSTDIILRMSTDGTILDASHASRVVLGYDPDELVGENCADLVTREYRDAILTIIRLAIDEPGPHRIALRFHTQEEGERWLECLVEGLRNFKDGVVREIVAVARDMSLRKQEEELRELRSMELSHVNRLVTLGEMAGQIAHHLHQPLTAISNYAGTMRNLIQKADGTFRENLEPFCDEIVNSAIRTGEFIHRIRAFTQRRGLRKHQESLSAIVANAFGLCEIRLQRNAVQTSYVEATDVPDVYVDAIQIEQVLVNLINNAIDAMVPRDAGRRRLSITAHAAPNGSVSVCVRDTGVGLSDGSQQSLFQPFFTTKPDGVGMGLVISRRIIEAHGGKLWLSSQPEGGMSVFFTISTGDENDDHD